MSANSSHLDFDLPRLSAGLPAAWRLEYFSELNSTNDWALDQFRSTPPIQPVLILARTQLRGRGRGDHLWQAPLGNLTCSVAFALNAHSSNASSPTLNWPARLAIAAALATLQTADHFLSGNSCRIKWPNDLLFNDHKLAGILIENTAGPTMPGTASTTRRTSIIGIGLNVNSTPQLTQKPESVPQTLRPTSLAAITSATHDLTTVVLQLANKLNLWLTGLTAFASLNTSPTQTIPDTALLEQLQQHLVWRGEAVTVRVGERLSHGILQGVDAAGQLELLSPSGRLLFASGELRRDSGFPERL